MTVIVIDGVNEIVGVTVGVRVRVTVGVGDTIGVSDGVTEIVGVIVGVTVGVADLVISGVGEIVAVIDGKRVAIGSRALRFLTKLGLYVLAVGAMYALLVFVFRLDAVTAELAATAPWLIAATFALGAVLLFLYDELLRRFARLYRRRKRG